MFSVIGCNIVCPIISIQQVAANRAVPDLSVYCQLPPVTTTTTMTSTSTSTTSSLVTDSQKLTQPCQDSPTNSKPLISIHTHSQAEIGT